MFLDAEQGHRCFIEIPHPPFYVTPVCAQVISKGSIEYLAAAKAAGATITGLASVSAEGMSLRVVS